MLHRLLSRHAGNSQTQLKDKMASRGLLSSQLELILSFSILKRKSGMLTFFTEFRLNTFIGDAFKKTHSFLIWIKLWYTYWLAGICILSLKTVTAMKRSSRGPEPLCCVLCSPRRKTTVIGRWHAGIQIKGTYLQVLKRIRRYQLEIFFCSFPCRRLHSTLFFPRVFCTTEIIFI